MSNDPIILAFSGGLDTSFCVPWLKETYGRDVITATVDTGGIDATAAQQLEDRSRALGAIEHVLVDCKQAFFDDVIRFLIAGNVLCGQAYPLCVGAERGLQAARLALSQRVEGLGDHPRLHLAAADGADDRPVAVHEHLGARPPGHRPVGADHGAQNDGPPRVDRGHEIVQHVGHGDHSRCASRCVRARIASRSASRTSPPRTRHSPATITSRTWE